MEKWYDGVKNMECFTCGGLCKPQQGDIILCEKCKTDYDGYVLMGCMNCGNNKAVLLTENLKPRLEWLRENGFAVKRVHHTYFAVYPFCPKCKPKSIFSRPDHIKKTYG